MNPEGYWMALGPGYNPKYRRTVWSLILLSKLGAPIRKDNRIAAALVGLGYANHPSFNNTLKLILDKQNENGQ